MNGPTGPFRPGGSRFSFGLLVVTAAAFGLLGGLPYFTGPVVAAVGAFASASMRRRGAGTVAVVPVTAALALIAATALVSSGAELLAAAAGLALLLWLADDPARAAGGGRRAVPVLAACAGAAGVAFALTVALPTLPPAIGVAGGLLAFVVLAAAALVERSARGAPASSGSA